MAPRAISVLATANVKSVNFKVSWVLTSGGHWCLVVLDKLWNRIVPRFPHVSNGVDNKIYFAELCQDQVAAQRTC